MTTTTSDAKKTTRIALLTGGSRGLGASMALHLADHGLDSIVTYREKADDAAAVVKAIEGKGRKAVALKLDVSQSTSFGDFAGQVAQALKSTWSRERFDCLVNNAGAALYSPIAETTEEQFDEVMRAHLKGPYFLTQKLLPLLNDGGRIVNISSGLTRFAFPGSAAYAMMKGGIEVFTRYLAKELGARKISVNTIAPGAIETDFGNGHVRDNKELNAQVASITALGRVGLPDDVGAAVAAILATDDGWINAQRIEVSGGTLI